MNKEMKLHTLKNKSFEGWYYRIKYNENSIVVIIGICKDYAFIEMFDDNYQCSSVRYNRNELYQIDDYFYLGDNYFNQESLVLKDNCFHIQIQGRIENHLYLSKNWYRPTIMGPFSYLKGMECNHAILFMNATFKGKITKHHCIEEVKGTAYLEKDWGSSFPRVYTWFQGQSNTDSIVGAIASIPLRYLNFEGIILALKHAKEEYIFASYYGAKVIHQEKRDNFYYLKIKQGRKIISLKIEKIKGCLLPAPKLGKMNQFIEESIHSTMEVKIHLGKVIIYQNIFYSLGFENTNFFK